MDFLSTSGDRFTVNFSMRVGSGMGPATLAPVRLAVSTISADDWSSMRKSKAFRRMRMRCPVIKWGSLLGLLVEHSVLDVLRHLLEVRRLHRVAGASFGQRT